MTRELSGVVLLISEDDDLVRSIREQLEDDGVDIVRTVFCADAEVLVRRYRPDLIAVDLTMRSLNGTRLIELAAHAKREAVPFVLVSSRPPLELAELARLVCATGVISRRTAAGNIAVPIRRWIPDAPELDIGPLVEAS